MTAGELALLLEGYRLASSTELELQDGIARVLTDASVSFDREVRLDSLSRPDFLVGAVVLEVKIGGAWAALVRQLRRYAESDQVAELLVATSCPRLARLPRELGGKPVSVALLRRFP